ncbi:type II secretion system protein F [Thermodesulfomicrobium sp. WS]|uniref:type II secretion system F family protein n=1 Tax=Thermodesulfomicrobium sp. WS TaxID=3004129 RepID=UPI002493C67C|nr:type II secretion system F family protein [Thermodesulfomicrobium sp. WS]BDV00009.1 type II secretion system protein F [Thermodesulfomicrobium sp. WS]
MAIFLYRVKTRGGRTLKGEMDAPSADIVEAALRRKGYQEIKVKPKPKDLLEGTFLEGGVSDRDMVVFSRQFATMINAGVPILQSLQILSEQTENPKLRRRLYGIRADIEGGSSLFDALRKYPDIFDSLYTNMVNAGEAGGILDQVLLRLADYIEKAAKLKAKIKGAMIYPAVVVTVAIAVIAVILIFVIPTFKTMFESMGGSLPAPTVFVINLSNFVINNFLLLLGGAVAAFVAFKFFYRWEKGQILVDRWVLFLPVFGPLLRKAAVAKFSRTLSTMVSSGVPILNALDIVSKTSGNKTVELGVNEARRAVAEGQTLAEPLEETGVFPPMVIHMVSIGEATGALDTMLGKIADFYDDEVDVAVESLTSLIEPVMIVFLGVVVGGLVISMYLPIFSIADVVSK